MAKKAATRTDELKTTLLEVEDKPSPPKPEHLLSTGNTLLNLACTGRVEGGFAPGTFNYLVGDTSSGKTFLSLTCLAEAVLHPIYSQYRFVFDNAENGAMMDFEKFFGKKVVDKLEAPGKNGECSLFLEEFYYNIDRLYQEGKPFIYILDSMDALQPMDDEEKFQSDRKGFDKGELPTSGTYGTAKAKANSVGMRSVCSKLRKTGSILIAISQTRQNIGFGSQFKPKTRSGGQSLTFYASQELWSSVGDHIKTKVRGKDWEQGITSKVKIHKSRLGGRMGITVSLPIFWSTGFDDVGGMIDWLVENKHWKKPKEDSPVTTLEFGDPRTEENLVKYIQDNNLEKDIKNITFEVWKQIEAECAVVRKKKYE